MVWEDTLVSTSTGRLFNLASPKAEDVCAEDIAHALSLTNRFAGHTRHPYSVAQHSVLMYRVCCAYTELRALAAAALLHDAEEAYVGDMTRPVDATTRIRGWHALKWRVREVILEKFGVDVRLARDRRLKELDQCIVVDEMMALLPPHRAWPFGADDAVGIAVEEWSWEKARSEWLTALEAATGVGGSKNAHLTKRRPTRSEKVDPSKLGGGGGTVTCIVGLEVEGGVVIGGDSAGVAGYHVSKRLDPKVFGVGPLAIGFTSSFRMGQLLQFGLDELAWPTSSSDRLEVYRWFVTTFVPRLRVLFKTGGYLHKKDERESGGAFLVGLGEFLFEIGDDFQVQMPADGYSAVGCGYEYALGALHERHGGDERDGHPGSCRDSVLRALRAAGYYSAGVCAPYRIIGTEGLPEEVHGE